jgi:hypothetical protein
MTAYLFPKFRILIPPGSVFKRSFYMYTVFIKLINFKMYSFDCLEVRYMKHLNDKACSEILTSDLCLFYSLYSRCPSGSPALPYKLTYRAEPFSRSRHLCSYSRTSQHFMEPEGSLLC